jgi:lipopolysaccharide biosynthesis glycosyltransferase
MDIIKIFIASEPGNEKAEQTLHWSIKNTTSGPFEIAWMTDILPEWQGWNKGRDNRKQNSGVGWATNFSCFRWAIPELCNFNGKAIYLDVDQLLIKDIRQMWELPMNDSAYLAIRPERTDVMLMDCSKFKNHWWPSINEMKPSGNLQNYYRKIVSKYCSVGKLDEIYNCLDGENYNESTRLIHYTNMNTQPWHPFPNVINYKPHKNEQISDLWNKCYELMEKCKLITTYGL